LDWSRRSYVAAYFAAADALENVSGRRFAVWALDAEQMTSTLPNLTMIRVPGGNNANVAAQAGLFTLLRQPYSRGRGFDGPESVCDYACSVGSFGLAKVTVPNSEAAKVLDLCERYCISAATLFPDFYGAAKATLIEQSRRRKSSWSAGNDIQVSTVPVRASSTDTSEKE
jgi:hypothetical protein